MFPLFETIRICDGEILNLKWHQQRLERSCKSYFGKKTAIALTDAISLPENVKTGFFKLKFSYDANDYRLQFEPYKFKKITSLKIIRDDDIEYSLKYTDRTLLDKLSDQKGICDDILIIKNNLVTDTSFANIVFYNGKNWLTPRTPLLRGTCRERLLREKKIFKADIKPEDLSHYTHFKLINAMRDFDEVDSSLVGHIGNTCPEAI